MRKSFPATELAEALGAAPVTWNAIAGRSYTRNTRRWRVELEDGRSVLVKLALDELAAGWLRDEHRVRATSGHVRGTSEAGARTRLRLRL